MREAMRWWHRRMRAGLAAVLLVATPPLPDARAATPGLLTTPETTLPSLPLQFWTFD
jgi:hypothetical protein